MALVPATLQQALQDIFDNPSGLRQTYQTDAEQQAALQQATKDCAQKWADAYFNYATSAMALDASPTTLVSSAPLAALFLASMQSMTFLEMLSTNLTAFWLTPPVLFVGPTNTGPATAPTATAALESAVATFKATNLAAPPNTPAVIAPLVAGMHAFTIGITVALVNVATGVPLVSPLL